MTYYTMPQDQGQMVQIEYAADGEFLYRRVTDRSDNSVVTKRVAWEDLDITGEFEPWNGRLGARVSDDDWSEA